MGEFFKIRGMNVTEEWAQNPNPPRSHNLAPPYNAGYMYPNPSSAPQGVDPSPVMKQAASPVYNPGVHPSRREAAG